MTDPARQMVGYLEDKQDIAQEVMDILPRAKYEMICEAEEAEMIKYASNAFYAVKVTFCNELFDICEAAKINYEQIKKAMKADPMTGPEHLEIWHKGYRGFGTPEVSKCLPKDVDALIAFSRLAGKYPELLRVVTKINHELAAMIEPKKEE
jgi:UDPglucose 6-dehydrogenase